MGVLSVHASQWAESEGSVTAREGQPSESDQSHNGRKKNADNSQGKEQIPVDKMTVLPRILQGKPIRVAIYPPSPKDTEKYQQAQEKVRQAYNAWFQNAVNIIESPSQHREQEFADVLPTLKQGVTIEFVDFLSGTQDVWVALDDTVERTQQSCKCSQCLGCESPGEGGKSIRITVPNGYDNVLLHEIGHTLGLADAYKNGYKKNASKTHRSKKRTEDTTMSAGGLRDLRADDADGLINIIDSWNIHDSKKLSDRVTKGWDSLDRNEKTGSSVDRYIMGTSETIYLKNNKK